MNLGINSHTFEPYIVKPYMRLLINFLQNETTGRITAVIKYNHEQEEIVLNKKADVEEFVKVSPDREMKDYMKRMRRLIQDSYEELKEAGETVTVQKIKERFLAKNQIHLN